MNLKEFMEQKAEEDFSSVLSESDKEYCRQLEAEYPVKNIRDKRKLWIILSCAFAVLVAAVITISIIFAPHKSPLKYQGEKKAVESTIVDLNSNTKHLEINFVDSAECEVYLNYDVESNDKLYYEMNVTGFFENAEFVFVINQDYEYEFEKPAGEENNKPMNGFEINYVIQPDSGLGSVKYTAWTKVKTETVYITYTQIMPLGDQAFFDYVQSVIKVK